MEGALLLILTSFTLITVWVAYNVGRTVHRYILDAHKFSPTALKKKARASAGDKDLRRAMASIRCMFGPT